MTLDRPRFRLTRTALPLLIAALCAAPAPWGAAARAQEAPAPALDLAVASYSPVPINFGFVSVRRTPPEALVSVRNLGSDDLVVSSIVPDHPAFTVEPSSLDPIPSGGSAAFRIVFDPEEVGAHDASIVVTSNDAFNPTYGLPVTGEAVDITVTVAPAQRLVIPSEQIAFSASLTGTPVTSVTWSLDGEGTITQEGIFTAPDTPGSTVIRATSTVDTAESGTASVLVLAPELTEPTDVALGPGRLGTRVRAVDLDGDGRKEVIASAPQADVDPGDGIRTGAGAVWIRTFGFTGFEGPVTLLTSPNPVVDGGFGAALVVRDLNGDGRPDVAVGEPGGTGAVVDSGVVDVFFGDGAGGFDPAVSAAPADGEAGDRFGAALAPGYFVGGPLPQLAVGAPGRTVNGEPGAGRVDVVDLASGSPSFPLAAPVVFPVAGEGAGAGFGTALAAACLDGCTNYGEADEAFQVNDLVVGAPGAAVTVAGTPLAGAGRVFALRADAAATPPAFAPAAELYASVPTAGAGFGRAVAAGDLTQSVLQDVVVGAPGQTVNVGGTDVNAGMAFVFVNDGVGGYLPYAQLRDPEPHADGRFGAALEVRRVDADVVRDLTVSAPAANAPGRVLTYFGSGRGDFGSLRVFEAAAPASGDAFGEGFAWRDLTADGVADLVTGVPGSAATTPDGGALAVRVMDVPDPIAIAPQRHLLARNGGRGDDVTFVGTVAPEEAVWTVENGRGTITDKGVFNSPPSVTSRLDNDVTVMLQDPLDDHRWALARVVLTDSISALNNPELLTGDQGELLMGLPEAGAHFGTSVAVTHLGRNLTDPYRDLPSVLGSFPAVNSTLVPRIPRFPYDDDLAAPFASVQFYFGRSEDLRTGWGSQLVTGDFNGDGNQDIAVAAPYAPSADSTEVQVGFVDMILLGDEGAPISGLIRISPSNAMLAPDGSPLWVGSDARSNTRYGYRILARDLNGDGRDDLVVGMPHADWGGLRDAGLVEVLLAPPSGDWVQSIVRATLAAPTPRQGGYFGSGLAVGDVTGDGFPELYVGAPGLDPEGREVLLKSDGMVHGFAPASWSHTTGEGLRAALNGAEHLAVTDPHPSPAGYYSAFGMTVHVANLLADDAADELIVGVPMRILVEPASRDFLGVPRKRETGAVDVFDGTGGLQVQAVAQLVPPTRETGLRFGSQLASGHLAGAGGPVFLAVGTPFYDSAAGPNAGAVFLYEPAPDGMPRYRATVTAPDEEALFQFGRAVAVGDADGDGGDELIVGAPDATIEVMTGVRIYPGRFRGPEAIIDTREQAGKVYVIFPGLP
jgi:hypothetical protein